MAPQNSQNCGRNLRKRKQSDAEFAGNSLLRMVIIDIVMKTLLGIVTRHPAGMHCPSWDDAFVSSSILKLTQSDPDYHQNLHKSFNFCFINRVVQLCNSLPSYVVHVVTVNCF